MAPRQGPRDTSAEQDVDQFVGIILICMNTVAPAQCDETTAVDVMSTGVHNELDCAMGWQEVVGRSPLRDEVGHSAYVKTLCKRSAGPATQPPAQRPAKPSG